MALVRPAHEPGSFALEVGKAIRSPGQVRGAWIIGLCFDMLALMRAIGGDASFSIFAGSMGVVIISVFAWRTGLWITADGIRVRNPLAAFSLNWDEVRSFRIGRHGMSRASCLIDLMDGSTRHAFAIQISNWSIRTKRPDPPERAIVMALNATLERRRAHAGTPAFRRVASANLEPSG
jgi:hypothetical protein